MPLTGKQFKQIQEALLSAYPSQELLRQMMRVEMEENLDAVAGGPNLSAQVFSLISWAEAHGKLAMLVQAAHRGNPRNPALHALAMDYGIADTLAEQRPAMEEPKQQQAQRGPAAPLDAGQAVAPELLVQALRAGAVAPFVGAGLSMGTGLPGWYDLIAGLARLSRQEMPPPAWAAADTLIGITQNFVNQQGMHALIAYLKERLDTTGRAPTAAHRALARLPVRLVFTANYDDLLERAFREEGKRTEIIIRDAHIPFMSHSSNVVNIVKLYGDLNQPDTLVLAGEQYEQFFLARPEMVKLLAVELGRSTLLYLGWSQSDPHFRLVLGETLARYSRFMRSGFAAMFDVSEAQQRELARKQIQFVELPAGTDRTERLAAWLRELGAAADTAQSV